jgi:hypothetical protein
MRFDEALEILIEHCASASGSLAAATGPYASSSRTSTYGNDIWIAHIARGYWASRIDPNTLGSEHYLPFYYAAWELCRIGVLRPGQNAPMSQGAIGGGIFSGDGYSITQFGHAWVRQFEAARER